MKSAQELAAALGVNEATLRLWRAEAGIPAKARNVGYSDEEEARIREIAANKRKSKPRKGDSAPELPRIVTEEALEPPISANTSTDLAAYLDGSSAHINANTRHWGRSDLWEDMVMAAFERIESKIDALTALLERAAIAPRYIARKSVDDALSDSAPLPAVYADLPPGTQPLAVFAGLHGVNRRTAHDHAQKALQGAFSITTRGTNGKQRYFVEPSQRAGVVAFWQRIGCAYSPCHECPHQEVQE